MNNQLRAQLGERLRPWVELNDEVAQEAWLEAFLATEDLSPEFFLALLDISNSTLDANPRSQLNIVDCVKLALGRTERPELVAAGHRAMCACYGLAGYMKESLTAVTAALELYRKIGDDEACGFQIANKIFILSRLGHYHVADKTAVTHEPYIHKINQPEILINFYWNWAYVKQGLRQSVEALDLLKKIELYVEKNGDVFQYADYNQTRASLLLEIGAFKESLILLQQSHAVLIGEPNAKTLLSYNVFSLALCHYWLGNLYLALYWANKALVWVRLFGPKSDKYQITFCLLGTILLALNQPERVLNHLDEIRDPTLVNPLTRMQLEEIEAIALIRLQKWSDAIRILKKVVTKGHSESQSRWLFRTKILQAQAYLDWFKHGRFEGAPIEDGYQSIVSLYDESEANVFYQSEILILLAEYELVLGRADQASAWLDQIDKNLTLSSHLKIVYFDLRGQIAEVKCQPSMAQTNYARAIEQSMSLGYELPNTLLQARFAQQYEDLFNRQLRVLVDLNQWPQIWELFESQRAQTLFAYGAHPQFLDRPESNPKMQHLLDLYYALRRSYFLLSQKIEQNKDRDVRIDSAAQIHHELYDTAAKMDDILQQIQGETLFDRRSFDDVCRSLADDTILITYKRVGNEVIVFAISATGWVVQKRLSLSWADIESAMVALKGTFDQFKYLLDEDALLDNVIAPKFDRNLRRCLNLLNYLYGQLWEPFAEKIEDSIDRIVVVADDALLQLPFAALYNSAKQEYLIDRYVLSYVPSASVYLACQERAKRKSQTMQNDILVFAHEGSSHAPLLHTKIEADAIKTVFPEAQVFTNEEASSTRLKSLAHRARILHLAGHGQTVERSGNPLLCSLMLAGETGHDEFFVYDLAQLDLRGAELVCLSGCSTGQSFDEGGHLLGLQWGVFNAGAHLLVGNLSEVHDKVTADLMTLFYQTYESHSDKAAVLRQAQLTIRQNGLDAGKTRMRSLMHPFVWAPFSTFGFTR